MFSSQFAQHQFVISGKITISLWLVITYLRIILTYSKDYHDYVDVCFKEFGDRVKYWITFNEPLIFTTLGYALGVLAPGRCTPTIGNCTAGDSGKEPYIVAHHQLLAHAVAVKLYKDKYQVNCHWKLGLCTKWNEFWYVYIAYELGLNGSKLHSRRAIKRGK